MTEALIERTHTEALKLAPEYTEGRDAFTSEDTNPYEPGTREHSAWAMGFESACDDWVDGCIDFADCG